MLSHHFRIQLTRQYVDSIFSTLWTRGLPQLAHQEGPIWHGTNAIAAALLANSEDAPPSMQAMQAKLRQECLLQYSAGLRQVLKMIQLGNLSPHNKITIILTNVTFFMCGMHRDDPTGAHAIILRSIYLVRQWKLWEFIDRSTASTTLAEALLWFVTIDRSAQEILLHTPATSPLWHWEEAVLWLQRRAFYSIMDPYLEMQMLWSGAHAVREGLPFVPEKEDIENGELKCCQLKQLLEIWWTRYQAFCANFIGGASLDSRRIAGTLHIQHMVLNVLLNVEIGNPGYPRDETCWDKFSDDFAQVLFLTESILEMSSEVEWSPRYTLSLWKSLQFTAKVCREHTMRRRAIAMLQKAIGAAFKTTASSCTLILDDIMNLEESAWAVCDETPRCIQGEFVCSKHRVISVDVDFKLRGASKWVIRTAEDALHNRPGRQYAGTEVKRWG